MDLERGEVEMERRGREQGGDRGGGNGRRVELGRKEENRHISHRRRGKEERKRRGGVEVEDQETGRSKERVGTGGGRGG